MENMLKKLFDYQKFENNARLSSLIKETEERYSAALSDEELFMVAAAGEPELNAEPNIKQDK